jgi:alpha-L-fucosidase
MEYAVLTAKHHDGFTMWPSDHGGFGTAEHCGGRDLVAPFVRACRRHGLKVGLYFSLPDWHHPSWPRSALGDEGIQTFVSGDGSSLPDDAGPYRPYRETIQGQLRELCTRYGDLDLVWFDTPQFHWAGECADRIGAFYALVRSHQPSAVVNGRAHHAAWGDYDTPENELPDRPPDRPWERCQTWCDHWAFVDGDAYRDEAWTLDAIARTRGRGGNLLLNVGPRADGTLPSTAHDRLAALGDWTAHSGASVVGADGGPWPRRTPEDVPVTRRDGTWYCHVLPGAPETVPVEDVPEPRAVRRLRDGGAVSWAHDPGRGNGRLAIEVPASDRASADEVIAVSWSADGAGRL